MSSIPRLDVKHTALLVVDVQEKLLPLIHEHERVLDQTVKLVDGALALGLPVIATEQYPKGLGATVPSLAGRLEQAKGVYEKVLFSALIEPVRQDLDALQARSVLVCGIEAHICILQTCLDLARAGFVPFVVADAVSSRRLEDKAVAMQRLTQADVIPTTVESALLELVHEAGTPQFKAILPLIR